MPSRLRSGEAGGLLIILMIGVAVVSIGLGAAVQTWGSTWRRDQEEELIFRGNQYADALLAYRKEHGGQFPLNLEELFKQGPRRLRYIRKLYKEPIGKDHKWGLLYLMPGSSQTGFNIYDPKAAQKAQQAAAAFGDDDDDSAWGAKQLTAGGQQGGGLHGAMPGDRTFPATGGVPPGAPPPGTLPPGVVPPQPLTDERGGPEEAERVSEPPIGWPVVGVISRAAGKVAEDTFRIYKGHEHVDEWQFVALDRSLDTMPAPGMGQPFMMPPGSLGPGFGGKGAWGGLGNGMNGPRPGGMGPRRPGANNMFPNDPRGGNNWPGRYPGPQGYPYPGWPNNNPNQQNQPQQ